MDRYVARPIVRFGLRDSSAKTAPDSTPTKPSTAIASSAPTPPVSRPAGDSPDRLSGPPAGWDRPATDRATTTTSSAVASTARILPTTSTRRGPSSATTAQAPRAYPHHG